MPNRLIYPTTGVLEKADGSDPKPIKSASMPDDSTLNVEYVSGSVDSFPVKDGKIEPYNNGLVSFTTDDGDTYTIRPLESEDGEWISDYGVDLPTNILTKMLFKEQGLGQMPYLQDANETMVAFSQPDSKDIYGVLYVNKFGAFIRYNGQWVGVKPSDDTFDDTIPYMVNADTAEEFVKEYDKGNMTVADAENYTTSPDDTTESK
jgi:hypothetical protein